MGENDVRLSNSIYPDKMPSKSVTDQDTTSLQWLKRYFSIMVQDNGRREKIRLVAMNTMFGCTYIFVYVLQAT